MEKPQLSVYIEAFIESLTTASKKPNSVWLIGSRANGRATENSDTDLLVFGTSDFFLSIKNEIAAPNKIDCLIVTDGNNFQDPWQEKSGSLESFKWQQLTDCHAEYIGTKWVPDEESSKEFDAEMGDSVERKESAFRLWPKI